MTKKNKKGKSLISNVDLKVTKDLLLRENSFISDVLGRLPIPAFDVEGDEVIEAGSGNQPLPLLASGSKEAGLDGKKTSRAKSLEELMSKLKELQGKKTSYKNKLAKKGLKNKLKKKKKNEERIMSKKLLRAQKTSDLKVESVDSEKTIRKPVKPVFNSEGKIVFSKFDFSEVGRNTKQKKEERDPKKILKQMEQQKEKLEQLKSSGDMEKVQEFKDKQAWALALKKTHGVKVKDDPELLKKSVKRLEQRKKHSGKKWKSREDNLKHQQEERQKKRIHSLQQRKDQNKKNKLKKAVKKGRVMPGF